MKRSAAIFAITASVLSLGAAAVITTSEQGQELVAQLTDRMTLPTGCTTEPAAEDGASYACVGVPVKEILANEKIAAASELSFDKSAFAGADFSKQNLVSLSISNPVDPGNVGGAVSTANISKALHLTNTPQSTLDKLKTDAKLIRFHRDDSTGKPQKPHKAHAATAPVLIVSDVFVEFDGKAAGEVRGLSISDPIDALKFDLRNYTSLDKVDLTVPAKAKVTLPKHLAGNKNLKIVRDGNWVTYQH